MKRSVFLHIGTHRTGTTSLQALLRAGPGVLKELGLLYPVGRYHPRNHLELHLAAMRDDRHSQTRDRHRDRNQELSRSQIAPQVHAWVQEQFDDHPNAVPIFSDEELSYLRYPDEIRELEKP